LSGHSLQHLNWRRRFMYSSKSGVYRFANDFKKNFKRCFILIFLSLCISVLVWLTTNGLCIAAHPVSLSTWFTRKLTPEFCKSGAICNVYFTLPEDPRTSMIINFHSKDMPTNAHVVYTQVGQEKPQTASCNWFKMDELREVDRYVYWADITGLEPGTEYSFLPVYTDLKGNRVEATAHYKIKTIPESGNVTFVQGGDMQNDWNGLQVSSVAASHSPLFALFGGDMSYANSNLYCYRRWDWWFHNWEAYMKTPQGLSIPLSLAIGNHEAGGDHMRKREDVHFYLDYFPQQLGLKDVHPKQRPLYHSHQISNHTLALVLDSGLVEPMIGKQSEWMEEKLSSKAVVNKVATYHYPLYPAVVLERFMSPQEKDVWVNIFERNNLTVGFENHFHVFKRSYPIRANQIDEENGVVYLGDGAWGIDNGITGLDGSSWWIQEAKQTAHVYVVTVSEKQLKAEAYDKFNHLLTSYTKVHKSTL